GIFLDESENSIIQTCWITRADPGILVAVHFANETNIKILDNYCFDNKGSGIEANPSGEGCVIKGNHVYDNGVSGILSLNATGGIISNNIIYGNVQYGILAYGNFSDFSGNRVYENGKTGMYFVSINRSTINGNAVYNNEEHGIYIEGHWNVCDGNVCEANDFSNTASFDGIVVAVGDRNVISSNRCTNNDRYEINVKDAICDRNLIHGNVVFGTDHVGTINDNGANTLQADNQAL
ncbi:unnamed protein product, partial [marine sediment metagenome]